MIDLEIKKLLEQGKINQSIIKLAEEVETIKEQLNNLTEER